MIFILHHYYFFSSRRRHTRWPRDWSSDVCSSDLRKGTQQYQDQIEQLGTQKARLEDAKRELQRINDLADKTVYDKRSEERRVGKECRYKRRRWYRRQKMEDIVRSYKLAIDQHSRR